MLEVFFGCAIVQILLLNLRWVRILWRIFTTDFGSFFIFFSFAVVLPTVLWTTKDLVSQNWLLSSSRHLISYLIRTNHQIAHTLVYWTQLAVLGVVWFLFVHRWYSTVITRIRSHHRLARLFPLLVLPLKLLIIVKNQIE